MILLDRPLKNKVILKIVLYFYTNYGKDKKKQVCSGTIVYRQAFARMVSIDNTRIHYSRAIGGPFFMVAGSCHTNTLATSVDDIPSSICRNPDFLAIQVFW